MTALDPLFERLEAARQGHLVEDWERLADDERARLAAELEALDLDLVVRLGALLKDPPDHAGAGAIEPPELFELDHRADPERTRRAHERGAELLAGGRVGYLLVAGGQASRLGYDGPKGTFPVGPVSGRSLFELHARRLRAAAERHGAGTPWYVMTSPANDAQTRDFFAQHDHFGLDPADVFFFSQAMNPALDFEGRVLRQAPDRLFLAPNGHGGVLLAFRESGALDDARKRGLEQLSYFQVDNPLVRPADELFLGLHAEAGAGMSSKVVAKRDAHEKVGVLGRIDGRMGCIEYSDLPDDHKEATDASGKLRFRAGNIAVHALALDFVAELTDGELKLPWHVARKAMKAWTPDGPAQVEGAKFETFVFDALGRSPASVTLEVERAHEFSPVKNAEGSDSPATARADLCALFADWVRAKGLALPPADADGVHPVEVDPLLAEDRDAFLALGDVAPRVSEQGHLYER